MKTKRARPTTDKWLTGFIEGMRRRGEEIARNIDCIETCELRREDWDFSKCPEDEWLRCYQYEYVRQSWSLRRIALFGLGALAGTEVYESYTRNPIAHRVAEMAELLHPPVDDFPEKPYLLLPLEVRQQFPITLLDARSGRLVDKGSIESYPSMNDNHYVCHRDYKVEVPVIRRIRGVTMHILPIMIDWSNTDDKLGVEFSEWLIKHRPEEMRGITTKGRNHPQAYLKFLSAYRLLARMSPLEASEHTASTCKINNGLFGLETEWWRARRNCIKHMKEVFLSTPDMPGDFESQLRKTHTESASRWVTFDGRLPAEPRKTKQRRIESLPFPATTPPSR